ncbi:hypothetical protein TNCV_4706441 [Trichonephila clavipes]|nr:hypothetical protein TNCV_4706441 [Trichonephila clavipes]
MYSTFAAWGYSKQPSSRKSSHEVGGERWEVLTPQGKLGDRAKSYCHLCMVLKAKANDSTIFEAHSHHPIKATHEKSCACYPIGSCHRFPRPPSPAKEQKQSDSKTR